MDWNLAKPWTSIHRSQRALRRAAGFLRRCRLWRHARGSHAGSWKGGMCRADHGTLGDEHPGRRWNIWVPGWSCHPQFGNLSDRWGVRGAESAGILCGAERGTLRCRLAGRKEFQQQKLWGQGRKWTLQLRTPGFYQLNCDLSHNSGCWQKSWPARMERTWQYCSPWDCWWDLNWLVSCKKMTDHVKCSVKEWRCLTPALNTFQRSDRKCGWNLLKYHIHHIGNAPQYCHHIIIERNQMVWHIKVITRYSYG